MKIIALVLLISSLSFGFDVEPFRIVNQRAASGEPLYNFGLIKPLTKSRELPSAKFVAADVKVPNDFYMPDKWPLPAGLPYDQGPCGSCVVNAVNGGATYSLSIRGLLPAGISPLSRGQVMNCNPSAGQCNGDWAENVGGWVVKHGKILPESVYPYSPRTASCRNISGTEYGPFIKGMPIDNSPESMGRALVTGYPVMITVGAGGAWFNPGTEIFSNCSNVGTNHEVLLIGIHARGSARGADGFIDFKSAKPTEIVYDILNSWGTSYGDKGVIHTQATDSSGRRCNNAAEEAYVLETGIPVPDLKPVDGGWTEWTACLNNQQTRACTNPSPANGGKVCEGPATQGCSIPTPISGIPFWIWVIIGFLGVLIVVLVIERLKNRGKQ